MINRFNPNLFYNFFSAKQVWTVSNPFQLFAFDLSKLKLEAMPTPNEILNDEYTIQVKHGDHYDYLFKGKLYQIQEKCVEEHRYDDNIHNISCCKPLKELSHIPNMEFLRSHYDRIGKNTELSFEKLISLNSCTSLTCGGSSAITEFGGNKEKKSGIIGHSLNTGELKKSQDDILSSLSLIDEKETSDCSTVKSGKCCCSSKKTIIPDTQNTSCCCENPTESTTKAHNELAEINLTKKNLKKSTNCCKSEALNQPIEKKQCCKSKTQEDKNLVSEKGCCKGNSKGCGCSTNDGSCFCSLTKELKHHHSLTCGHPYILHLNHICYIVEGRLHFPHGDHCDDHGPIDMHDSRLKSAEIIEGTNF